ncbi:hypothetical protein PF005_g18151 [Phytophthora fragariae]|uniref:RxLR effector protein n=1 Tax=Phytophthora fragariae TaxID=53985 RepID=A0A6A3EGK0_9STRA|nr:hypothetical protein PF003_g23221 [Phytophthora fragariae]KAE8932742.1 hypothetical protein PF009_g17235 [Phytophthora fragariae]KAE9093184.1 hypothetical protein PF010_g17584 [Phytophthora fragariae]KAE9111859.1 hypothetical protein PF007_g11327 [Phytophthora fragariae]KAE9144618.1 hypothetical protein PF006_g10473 [Phytophthora fragariae]
MRAAALTINLLSLSYFSPQVLAAGHTDQVRLLIRNAGVIQRAYHSHRRAVRHRRFTARRLR